MKIVLLIFFGFLSFCSQPIHEGGLDTSAKENNTIINAKAKNLNTIAKEGNFKVDIYEDNNLIGSYLYDNGLLQQELFPANSSENQEQITKYYYKENGVYDRLEVIKGQDSTSDDWLDRLMRDFQFHRETLNAKGIQFPLASELLSSEVSDLSNVLSVANGYDDFKKETITEENRKIIRFVGFNKNIRFYPSYITMFIPENTFIKDYELTLTDNFPQKEVYKTDDGVLVREYFYSNKKIVKVMNKFIDKNDDSSFERRFEYQKLE
jgi:hypothetical protein